MAAKSKDTPAVHSPLVGTKAPSELKDIALAGFRTGERVDRLRTGLKQTIRKMREARALSVNDLADALNVKPSVVSRFESLDDLRMPTLPTLLRIAEACDYKLEIQLTSVAGKHAGVGTADYAGALRRHAVGEVADTEPEIQMTSIRRHAAE
jgi:transcriptional regulator with XRE-family HTH domain